MFQLQDFPAPDVSAPAIFQIESEFSCQNNPIPEIALFLQHQSSKSKKKLNKVKLLQVSTATNK